MQKSSYVLVNGRLTLFGLERFHSFTFLCNGDMPPDHTLLKSMTKKPLQNSSNQLNNLLVVLAGSQWEDEVLP